MTSVSLEPATGVPPTVRLRRETVVPTVIGTALVLVAVLLALVSWHQARVSEQHLLRLRVRDAGLVLAEALPDFQTPMASAAALAAATHGDPIRFRHLVAPEVGAPPAHPFVSLSLWRLEAGGPRRVVTVGRRPRLSFADAPGAFGTARDGRLGLVGELAGPRPRLGYVLSASSGWVIYGEGAIQPNRRAPIARSSAFAGLSYAIYLGRAQAPGRLLATNVAAPLLAGAESMIVPFGAGAFTLVMASPRPLDGALPHELPLIILGAGGLLALAVALVSRDLERRRASAVALASQLEAVALENQRLYAEQRGIAETLQSALLPASLPSGSRIRSAARPRAGVHGLEVGGDWYDVIELDTGRVLMIVGDVSGRGLGAATTMAGLRHAMRAYAADDLSPAVILTKLGRLLDVGTDGRLATVLCVELDVTAGTLAAASAGHLPPLLIGDGPPRYLRLEVGVPIGARPGHPYTQSVTAAPAEGTLLGFTDGLVEERHESLDRGLARLAERLRGNDQKVEALLETLLEDRAGPAADDDVAIVGVTWTT